MTVAAQPAALPLQLEATLPAAAPGVPTADLFGGLVAALATSIVVKPVAAGASEAIVTELPAAPVEPSAEAPPAAADQLIALTCAMPAQTPLLVRKPGETIASRTPAGDTAESESEEHPPACGFDAVPTVPIGTPIVPAAPVAPTPQAAIAAAVTAATAQPRKAEPGQPTPVLVELAPAQPDLARKPAPLAPEILKALQAPSADPVRDTLRTVLAHAAPGIKQATAKVAAAALLAPELKNAAAFTPMPFLTPESAPRADVSVTSALPVEPDTGELIIERQLDLAAGDEWLDDLAKDIARSAGDAPLKFKLNPEHLGSLRVEIANDRGGAAVRLTTDTETARAIIAEAQPRLIAEARAQGLRISESHVDLGQQPGSDANRRHAEGGHEPQLRTARSVQEDSERDGKPTRRNSERYA